MRLFVAVSIPRSHLEHVDEQIAPFRDKVSNARWTTIENQHVTLKFLGSTPTDRIEHVEAVCRMVAAGRRAAPVRLSEVGAFPSRGRIRVLWLGLEDEAGLLTGLSEDLDRALEPLGFPAEARSFTPHLTLARFKIPVPLRAGLPGAEVESLEPFPIERIELFRSHLSPTGARYEVIGIYPLAAT